MGIYNKDSKLFDGEKLKLTPEQIDSLMELGNIGSGNAITALSQLLNSKIDMSLTDLEIVPFWKLPDKLGGCDVEVVGIYSDVKGTNKLSILQIFPSESIINLINFLSKDKDKKITKLKNLKDLDDFSYSIIVETGNILSGHYTSSLANLMSIALIPDVPDVALDSIGAILDGIVARCSEFIDIMLVIRTKLQVEEIDLSGTFCYFPDVETLNKLFKTLNIVCNL